MGLTALSVSRIAARRFLLETQFLLSTNKAFKEGSGPESALQLIKKLECVQLDPVSVAERNQHLVLAARLPHYKPEFLDNRLLSENKVFEYIANAACVIPMEDYPIFKPIRSRHQQQLKIPLRETRKGVKEVLERLKAEGPLPSRAFKSDTRVHGYWDNVTAKTKETSHALNLLLDAGIVRVVRRERTERFFGLTESTIPENIQSRAKTVRIPAARKALIEKYMRAYRLFDAGDPRFGWQKMTAAERRAEVARRVKNESVVAVEMENVTRQYYMLAEDVEKLKEIERFSREEPTILDAPIRFLPPLDNLLWRRERLEDLFGFYYRWEIYIPRSKRRYGAYAMPILYGDRLIGRMDPCLNRKESCLEVRLLQLEPDVELTPDLRNRLLEALQQFAEFHQAYNVTIERTEPSKWLSL